MLFNVEYFVFKYLTQHYYVILKILLTEQKEVEQFNLKLLAQIHA